VKQTVLTIITIALLFFPGNGRAFYQWQNGENYGEVAGLVRAFGIAWQNPVDIPFYERQSDAGLAAIGRIFLSYQKGNRLSFEVNAYQTSRLTCQS